MLVFAHPSRTFRGPTLRPLYDRVRFIVSFVSGSNILRLIDGETCLYVTTSLSVDNSGGYSSCATRLMSTFARVPVFSQLAWLCNSAMLFRRMSSFDCMAFHPKPSFEAVSCCKSQSWGCTGCHTSSPSVRIPRWTSCKRTYARQKRDIGLAGRVCVCQ
jgi:hypothetical protein